MVLKVSSPFGEALRSTVHIGIVKGEYQSNKTNPDIFFYTLSVNKRESKPTLEPDIDKLAIDPYS